MKKGVFFKNFLPSDICFHFQMCLLCVWFSRCKTDPWGQAVQVFYFSHHCTHRRTEFGISYFMWGKSLPIHAVFKNVDFSCRNTKKPLSFSAAKELLQAGIKLQTLDSLPHNTFFSLKWESCEKQK